jgi:hypothetical protein
MPSLDHLADDCGIYAPFKLKRQPFHPNLYADFAMGAGSDAFCAEFSKFKLTYLA